MSTSAKPESFDQVEPGSGNSSACTPEVEEGFVGLKINAPVEVVYTPGHREPISGAFARIMLCGVYRLDAAFIYRAGGVLASLTVVATDADRHVSFSGKLVHDHPFEPSPVSYSEEQLAKMKSQFETGYFNENIAEFLELPEQSARYNIFVTLATYTSNVVTVDLTSER